MNWPNAREAPSPLYTNSTRPNRVRQAAVFGPNQFCRVERLEDVCSVSGHVTWSNSRSSSRVREWRCSLAKVLIIKSLSRVPRFRVWYVSLARSISSDSLCLGTGIGFGMSGGMVVASMCCLVCGNGHGSALLYGVVENRRCRGRRMRIDNIL